MSSTTAEPPAGAPRAIRLLRVGLTTASLAGTAAFFRDALGFEPEDAATGGAAADPGLAALAGARAAFVTRLRLGAQTLELATFDPPGQPYPTGSTATDLWFQHIAIVVSDMAAAFAQASAHGAVPISTGGPQRLPPGSGGVTAWKFRDPEGHPLELLHFPPGAGDPAWHGAAAGPFLGIDHSAISVADAERSRRFYADALGLTVAQTSLNRGPEQGRLDGAPGVVAEVVALNLVEAPPHLELLAYRSPAGRPSATRPTDVAATRLVLAVAGLPQAGAAIVRAGGTLLRSGTLTVGGPVPATLASDPDGHELVLVESVLPG